MPVIAITKVYICLYTIAIYKQKMARLRQRNRNRSQRRRKKTRKQHRLQNRKMISRRSWRLLVTTTTLLMNTNTYFNLAMTPTRHLKRKRRGRKSGLLKVRTTTLMMTTLIPIVQPQKKHVLWKKNGKVWRSGKPLRWRKIGPSQNRSQSPSYP